MEARSKLEKRGVRWSIGLRDVFRGYAEISYVGHKCVVLKNQCTDG